MGVPYSNDVWPILLDNSKADTSTNDGLVYELYEMVRDWGEDYIVIKTHPHVADNLMSMVENARREMGDL